MAKGKGIFGSIGSLFRKLAGERAAGNAPPLPPKPAAPPPEIERGQIILDIGGDADTKLQLFLYFNEKLPVTSSNVRDLQYWIEQRRLVVAFKAHGSHYEYPNVSPEMAYDFATAISKGRWVWSWLRCSGRKFEYRFLYSEDGHVPRRLQDPCRSTTASERLKKWIREEKAKPRFAKLKKKENLKKLRERYLKSKFHKVQQRLAGLTGKLMDLETRQKQRERREAITGAFGRMQQRIRNLEKIARGGR